MMQIKTNSERCLLIIGAGAHSQVVREIAEQLNYAEFYYLDDNIKRNDVIGSIKDLQNYKKIINDVFISIGDNALRKELYEDVVDCGFNIPTLVSEKAYISRTAFVGSGSLICPMACIQSNVMIGTGCFISSGAIIDHDVVVSNFAHVNSGTICKSNSKVPEMEKI